MSKTQDQGLVYRRAFITLDKRLQNFKFLDKLEGGREREVRNSHPTFLKFRDRAKPCPHKTYRWRASWAHSVSIRDAPLTFVQPITALAALPALGCLTGYRTIAFEHYSPLWTSFRDILHPHWLPYWTHPHRLGWYRSSGLPQHLHYTGVPLWNLHWWG